MTQPPRFLTAEWRALVMLNYVVDPAILAPRVPVGVTLDTWQGQTLVSMVGFRFLRTRLMGAPVPFHTDFDEVNLRFYVRRDTPTEARRGVVFVKEIVPLPALAWVARAVYNENYVALPMRHVVSLPTTAADRGRIAYEWRLNGHWNHLAAAIEGEPSPLAPGSEAEFITEHYWGYARQRDGSTLEYGVEHPRWNVWRATSAAFECDVAALYGAEFAPFLSRPPTSAFVADGSPVVVRRGVPLV